MIESSVSIFGQTAVYRIYAVSVESIRLPGRISISSVWYLIKIFIYFNIINYTFTQQGNTRNKVDGTRFRDQTKNPAYFYCFK